MSSAAKFTPPSEPQEPTPKPAPEITETEKRQAHFENVHALCEIYEAEFRKVAANPHAPPDQVGQLLLALTGLRAEVQHLRR